MSRVKLVRGLSRSVRPRRDLRASTEYHFAYTQYGAEMMESSVKSISRPVIDRLPVNQLDEFACRQLDKVSILILLVS